MLNVLFLEDDMACMENICQDHVCGWSQFSNESFTECPRCGGKVLNYFDEEPYQYESPSGDDYDDLLEEDD